MKVTELLEGKDIGYDEERKVVLGDVKVWLKNMDVTPEKLVHIIKLAKETPEYDALTSVVKDISTRLEQKNGTFSFEHPRRDKSETKYHVYANGQIRMSYMLGDKRTPTRLVSPKPELRAGQAEESFVHIYVNAFKELLKKAKKVKATESLAEGEVVDNAAIALAKGLSKIHGGSVTLPANIVLSLKGLKANGAVKDLGECVFDHDTLGKRTAPKESYFTPDHSDAHQKIQLKELPDVKKLASGRSKEGEYLYVFKHKTLPIVYVVSSDGESGMWGVSRFGVKEVTAEVK